jgi:hypothetical protein
VSAVRAYALPKLSNFHLYLYRDYHWNLFAEGLLDRLPLEELDVVPPRGGVRHLERLRRFLLLRSLSVATIGASWTPPPFPPFIPSSLKTFALDVTPEDVLESVLRAGRRAGPAWRRSA